MEIDPKEVVEFLSPIYGFENLRRFVLLYDDNIPPFTWMQSIEEPRGCFIMVDPAIAAKDYAPQLPEDTKKLLQIEKTEDTVWRALTVIPHNVTGQPHGRGHSLIALPMHPQLFDLCRLFLRHTFTPKTKRAKKPPFSDSFSAPKCRIYRQSEYIIIRWNPCKSRIYV